MNKQAIEQKIFDLYDEYCHGAMDRREFFRRAGLFGVGSVYALSFAQSLLPRYAEAHTISFTDERIKATYVDYPSPGGVSGEMRGYLVQPTGNGPFPAVVVIHENRGLNPYVEDVARRAAVAGFLCLAPDALSPVGGYPGNDDDGRTLQRSLDQVKLKQDMVNSALLLKNHELSNGKLGATGFCWGGGITNHLAVTLGKELLAAVPYYGAAPPADQVGKIHASLMVQSASDDPRVNAMWPDYETALKAQKISYQRFVYPSTRHGFHNNSTPRFDQAAADLSWKRTIELFRRQLT